MNRNNIIIFLALLLLHIKVVGQEDAVRPLIYNPAYSKIENVGHSLKAGMLKSQVVLPFFDDFSYNLADSIIYPDQIFWCDSDVYINSSYSNDPISIGFATFDALDKHGKLYPQVLTSDHFLADKLTSDSIQFGSLTPADSVYLSFYYQPAGIGEIPDPADSFMLQFRSPVKKIWETIWAVPGSAKKPFQRVMIPITDTLYIKNGFQFRFCNFASISESNTTAGHDGNGDIWNLDYVQLGPGRKFDDTIVRDLAIIRPLYSPLLNFESIPWSHFSRPDVYQKAMGSSLNLWIRNNDDVERTATRTYKVDDVLEGTTFNLFTSSSAQILAGKTDAFFDTLPDPLISLSKDSAIFRFTASLENDSAYDKKQNDTVRYYQVFNNYYAYDDGTAEYGYGLVGVGSAGAMMAYKFTGYVSDTLWAVKMNFNRSLRDANVQPFSLTVWSCSGGKPDKILYQKDSVDNEAYKPDPSYEMLNKFKTYYLDTPVVVPDTFFVGWTQISETFLNIGLDINRNVGYNPSDNSKNRIYMNFIGTPDDWSTTHRTGALMIRPVVGTYRQVRVKPRQLIEGKLLTYPNPVIDKLNIKLPGNSVPSNATVYIFDLTGKMVLNKTFIGKSIDIGGLNPGVYLFRLQSNTGQMYNGKVIKGVR
jgi:hypothetical protein